MTSNQRTQMLPKIQVRPANVDDAVELYTLEKAIILAGIGVVQGLDDISATEEDYSIRLATALEEDTASTYIGVALESDQIIGSVRIDRLPPSRLRHVGSLSIGVHPEHQRKRAGTELIRHALIWAREIQPPLVRIELGVDARNENAISLYKKFGFTLESVRRRFIKNPDGTESDDLSMVLFLD